jgi:hypothetical protein
LDPRGLVSFLNKHLTDKPKATSSKKS